MTVIFIDEELGVDAHETPGTESTPFKILLEALFHHGPDTEYRATNYAANRRKKLEAASKREEKEAAEDAAREAVLEEAKKIQIIDGPALPKPVLIGLAETDPAIIGHLRKGKDETTDAVRVRVQGRVQRVAKQGGLIFVVLRRGVNKMQCLLSGDLSKIYQALTLTRETAMEITGEMWEVPAGHDAPLNRELRADHFKIISPAPGGDETFTNRVPLDGDAQTLLNLRHLALRQEKPLDVMFVRHVVEAAFHAAYKELDCKKVSPPALVQTQAEGGSALFKFDYYGETSYLTQSSQLYLETVLPVLDDVYCIEKSFRAEKALTRRHMGFFYCTPETVGGSMRIWDYEELMAAYKREGIDPTSYYWYTDQRKYGSTPHGGYGLGAERCEIPGIAND
ncbi:hypothetical protein QQZ08_008896 [Neonectria magnoliae]|uniref:Aminoacyl-tRNA synthetase class II (D/K/N) domain-containing protein n=1 Tax=Neonectria magnoliae TaxID=2732573 RepID=A0ABR1HRM6_9HYPO